MRIGITERGDAGRDCGWYEKCHDRKVDGAILITKSLTQGMGERALALFHEGFPLIIHVGCTGWGGSWLEPGAFTPDQQLCATKALIEKGFPARNMVLRIDPVIPTDEGIERVKLVLDRAFAMEIIGGNESARLRFSIMDEYRHVKQRLIASGHQPFYGPNDFQCGRNAKDGVIAVLGNWRMDTLVAFPGAKLPRFESCGEDPQLVEQKGAFADQFEVAGCISNKDLRIMGLPEVTGDATNPQGRQFCRCLSCKTELLEHKHPCKNACKYCYWRNQ